MEEIAGKNYSIPLTEEQRKIVEAAPDARILVTAGPGTGKTHVLTARLANLIDRYEMSPGADLLVLSFSRAAIREVRLRLAAQDSDSRYVSAVTFDSFATRLLAEVDPQGVWSGMSYEGRIQEATKLVLGNDQAVELVSGIRHIMVDEIQDLVGERADFVRAILGKVGNGFTLFGDPAQGIYTFQLDKKNKELGAAALYQWLQQRFPDLVLHSLTVNHRAQTTAAKRALWAGQRLNEPHPRYSDIWFGLETEVFRCRSGNIEHYARELSKPNMSTAILCRTNGQVLLVSRELHQHGIAHHVQRLASERVVPAWVATVLGDAQLKKIKRSVFEQLFTERVASDVTNPDSAWQLLKQMDGSPGSSLDIGVVAMRIRAGFVPDELLEYPKSSLIVSTIHRAKGLEFDRVLLAGTGSSSRESGETDIAEETRILYVGMTRPRQELWHLQLPDCVGVSKSERTGRWIRRKYKGLITNVEIWGDDVHREDPACAYLQTECDPLDTQKYIANALHRGAPVKATLLVAATNGDARGFYLVSHEGRPIGVTSEAFGESLYSILKLHPHWQVNWPVEISDLTVEGIDSVVGSEAAGKRVGLGTAGLWLRARIGGFGRLHFEPLADKKR